MILVIGASGFIGTYLVKKLVDSGHEVVATGRSERFAGHYGRMGVRYIRFDLGRKEDIDLLPTDGIEAVVLLAAMLPANMPGDEDAQKYIDVNITGTLNILEYCRRNGIRKIISATSYADVSGKWSADVRIDDDTLRDYSLSGDHAVYVISKNAASDLIEYYNNTYGMQGAIFRFPPVYGVGPHSSLYNNGVLRKSGFQIFVDRAVAGEDIEIYGQDTYRDIVYIDDVVDAFCLALESDNAKGIYNIMSGESSSLEQQALDVIDVFTPAGAAKKSKVIRRPDIPNCSASYSFSIEKARRDFGYSPKFVPFHKLVEAYKAELDNPRFPDLFPQEK